MEVLVVHAEEQDLQRMTETVVRGMQLAAARRQDLHRRVLGDLNEEVYGDEADDSGNDPERR